MCMLHYKVSVMWIIIQSKDQTSLSEDISAMYCLVPGREYSVGRGTCDLNIDSQSVSGKHATISVRTKEDSDKTSEVWIIDDSRFGTYVNSEQLHRSECQIFSGDELVFGKWNRVSDTYTYSLRWDPIVLCYSGWGKSAPPLRICLSKYNVTLLDSWDDSTTHVVVNELTTTIKVLSGLAKGIPIVQQSWVDQLIRAIQDFTPLPKASDHMPDIPEGYDISDVSLFDVNLKRRSLFEGKTFYFLNIREYEQLHIPISYCKGTSTLVSVSDFKFATFDRYAAADSVVVSNKFDEFCSAQGGTEFISQLQLALEAEEKTIMTNHNIIHSILQVTTDIVSAQQSQVSEHYTTPPESSDNVHTQVSEEDELFPLRKKAKVNVRLFPDDQSTSENMNEFISINKNSSPPQSRKHLTELNFNQEEKTSSAVDTDTSNLQLSKTEPFETMNGFKVLRKCFVKYQPKKEVTYISPLVPYVSSNNELAQYSSETIIEPTSTSRSQQPTKKKIKLETETTAKNTIKFSGEFQSPPRKSWIVIDSSDEDDTFLSVTPL